MRPSKREPDQLREFSFETHYTKHAEGSVLVSYGETKVLCTASVEERVPSFLKGKGQGWITAEYGMLPRSTGSRNAREAARGKQSGRTLEIQRLIGRSLRSVVDLKALGERQVTIDCDVIQADGGTRTASISGGYVALGLAMQKLIKDDKIAQSPIHGQVAAISVGIYKGKVVLDLDYLEDSVAETDMNIVMNETGAFIELQGTAEGHAFHPSELHEMLELGQKGIQDILAEQRKALGERD